MKKFLFFLPLVAIGIVTIAQTPFQGPRPGPVIISQPMTTAQVTSIINQYTSNTLAASIPDLGGDLTNVTFVSQPGATYVQYAMSWPATNFGFTGANQTNAAGPGNAYFFPAFQQTGLSGAILPSSTPGFHFGCDSLEAVVNMYTLGANYAKIVIDDVDVQRIVLPTADSVNYMRLQFASQKPRKVSIYAGNDGYAGVYLPTSNALYKPFPMPTKKLMILGDSYIDISDGHNSEIFCSLPRALYNELLPYGWDVIGYGQGGTGYVNPSGSGYTNFFGRFKDITNVAPDALLIFGGYNDASWGSNALQSNIIFTNATNLLWQARLARPNMPIFVIGPQWPGTTTANALNVASLLRAASAAVTNITYADPANEGWLTGLLGGTGTASRYLNTDAVHLNGYGSIYFAKKIAAVLNPMLTNSVVEGGSLRLSAYQTSGVVLTGYGTPEAIVTANIGSLFLRLDGGASTTLYVKTSGTGNTGWTAK